MDSSCGPEFSSQDSCYSLLIGLPQFSLATPKGKCEWECWAARVSLGQATWKTLPSIIWMATRDHPETKAIHRKCIARRILRGQPRAQVMPRVPSTPMPRRINLHIARRKTPAHRKSWLSMTPGRQLIEMRKTLLRHPTASKYTRWHVSTAPSCLRSATESRS